MRMVRARAVCILRRWRGRNDCRGLFCVWISGKRGEGPILHRSIAGRSPPELSCRGARAPRPGTGDCGSVSFSRTNGRGTSAGVGGLRLIEGGGRIVVPGENCRMRVRGRWSGTRVVYPPSKMIACADGLGIQLMQSSCRSGVMCFGGDGYLRSRPSVLLQMRAPGNGALGV